ncbi:MAG: hypothetical protein Q9Q40_13095 [Acidobacteriota bacterium]|nr:hypothetical protein [Acidobacteriota bacterium]MDQ7087172.1 hypothetical protein [Acidobacteriota bacterium]
MDGGKQEGLERSGARLDAERIFRSSGWDRLFVGAGWLLVLLFGLFVLRGWLPGRAEALSPVGPDSVLLMEPLALGETAAEREWASTLAAALATHLEGRTRVIRAGTSSSGPTTYIPHLARQAGARAALRATVFQVEGGMRIQVRLIPADSTTRRWRRRYELAWPGGVSEQADTVAREVVLALYGSDPE